MVKRRIYYNAETDNYEITNCDNETVVVIDRSFGDDWMRSNICLRVVEVDEEFDVEPLVMVEHYGLSQNELRMMVLGVI